MINRFQKSVIFRMGALMVAMVTLAMVTMLASYFNADSAATDAEAVNLAGSLRMHSYRLLSHAALESQAVNDSNDKDPLNIAMTPSIGKFIEQFEARLEHATLRAEAQENENSELHQQYLQIREMWSQRIKPVFAQGALYSRDNARQLTQLTEQFVNELDALVKLFQMQAESRIEQLRFLQIVALFMTLLLVVISLLILHFRVEVPLRQLTQNARQIGEGDFQHSITVSSEDELGLLAKTLNHMSAQLNGMYANLEIRVLEKTRELKQSHDSLNFLYELARAVSGDNESLMGIQEGGKLNFQIWLDELSAITGVQGMELCLKTPEAIIPYDHLRTDDELALPSVCIKRDCEGCLHNSPSIEKQDQSIYVRYPLIKEGAQYGVLVGVLNRDVVANESGNQLQEWQHQLMQSFADQVAIALSLKDQQDQERRVSLMTERNTIARELHDSLAQALSYLRIQVTRLNRTISKQPINEAALLSISEELQEGTTSAYRQLRELLTTFRLTVSEKGLRAALEHTVSQLKDQNQAAAISLEYRVDDIPLTPNEEIHLLQICREALQNAVKHSKGDSIKVSLTRDTKRNLSLAVVDNGIGIPDNAEKLNHYGLAIMSERSRNLGGELEIRRVEPSGTGIFFSFVPEFVRLSQAGGKSEEALSSANYLARES